VSKKNDYKGNAVPAGTPEARQIQEIHRRTGVWVGLKKERNDES